MACTSGLDMSRGLLSETADSYSSKAPHKTYPSQYLEQYVGCLVKYPRTCVVHDNIHSPVNGFGFQSGLLELFGRRSNI